MCNVWLPTEVEQGRIWALAVPLLLCSLVPYIQNSTAMAAVALVWNTDCNVCTLSLPCFGFYFPQVFVFQGYFDLSSVWLIFSFSRPPAPLETITFPLFPAMPSTVCAQSWHLMCRYSLVWYDSAETLFAFQRQFLFGFCAAEGVTVRETGNTLHKLCHCHSRAMCLSPTPFTFKCEGGTPKLSFIFQLAKLCRFCSLFCGVWMFGVGVFWWQVLKLSLVLLLFFGCSVLDDSLTALGSMVGFEARTINEYTTVSVAEK